MLEGPTVIIETRLTLKSWLPQVWQTLDLTPPAAGHWPGLLRPEIAALPFAWPLRPSWLGPGRCAPLRGRASDPGCTRCTSASALQEPVNRV